MVVATGIPLVAIEAEALAVPFRHLLGHEAPLVALGADRLADH
jgi:hypothetical protein